MQITVLIENNASGELSCEPGLSLSVRLNGHHFLVDTGLSGAFADNASALGICLSDVEAVFLSHGHNDHSGGLPRFFSLNGHAPVWCMPNAMQPSRMRIPGGWSDDGMPSGVYESHSERFRPVYHACSPLPGIHLLPHTTPGLDAIGKRVGQYVRKADRSWQADCFDHEMTVVLEAGGALTVISPCSHAGMINILKEVCAALPGRPIRSFIGGLHMVTGDSGCAYSQTEINEMAACARECGVRTMAVGHCTGAEGYARMAEAFGEKNVQPLTTGTVLDLSSCL